MNISVSTQNDLNAVRSLFYVSIFKKKDPKKCIGVYITIMLIVIATSLVLQIVDGGIEGWSTPISIIVLFVMTVFLYYRVPAMMYKSMGPNFPPKNQYIFSENGFHIESEGNGNRGASDFSYSAIYRVMENSKYLFIFINRNQGYIVGKSDLAEGDEEILTAHLKAKLQENYIVCKY